MSKSIVILFLLVSVRVQAQTVIQSRDCGGIIHGAVFDHSGQRVKGLTVVAWPLGMDLAALLPTIATDEKGEYRFENVCPGRYAVVVEDEKAGYPLASPHLNEFLYGARIAEVKLTAKHPQAKLRVDLPPKPAFMQVQVINQETKAEVLKFSVKLKVPGQHRQPQISVEFDSSVKNHKIPLPPDKDVVLHLTADGFHEWSESTGHGKVIRVASGTEAAIAPELEPSNGQESNHLRR